MKTPTVKPWLSRLTLFAAAFAAVLAIVPRAKAQVWTETGDAGQLVASAQSTLGTGPLTGINGILASPTDVDLYCVRLTGVPPAGLPLVQLGCAVTNGPNVWLFDSNGKGVFTNMTCQGGEKAILAPSTSLAPGIYYVAVSFSEVDPQAAAGPIWVPALPGQRAPDGAGAAGTLNAWSGFAMVQPINPYHLDLGLMTYCSAAVPTLRATWGFLKTFYR